MIRHTFSPYHTTRKWAPLSGGARCLLSGPLRPGVRFLRDPIPAAPSHALQLADPCGPSAGEDNGFTEFHDDDTVGWVLPLYRRYYVSVARSGIRQPTANHFGSGAYSYFRLSIMTVVASSSLRVHPTTEPSPLSAV